jgi:di/tricarboxylate transporter
VTAASTSRKPPRRIFLAVAYGASIGGIGTLVGTPPNLVLAGMAPNLVPGLEAHELRTAGCCSGCRS